MSGCVWVWVFCWFFSVVCLFCCCCCGCLVGLLGVWGRVWGEGWIQWRNNWQHHPWTNEFSIRIKCCIFFFNSLMMYKSSTIYFSEQGKNNWNCISVPYCRDLVLCCKILFNNRIWIRSWNALKVWKMIFVLVEDTSGRFISLSLIYWHIHNFCDYIRKPQ